MNLDSSLPTSSRFKQMQTLIDRLQDEICCDLIDLNEKKFREDKWHKKDGGGGVSRIFQSGGKFLEKGGVNCSSIHGEISPEMKSQLKINIENNNNHFFACGLSIVLHPYSPWIPTIHMNIRYFEIPLGMAWYGGGIDLTPYLPAEDHFVNFHKHLEKICESINPNTYLKYKQKADEYFFIQHRNEMRGIGGIFYDHLDGKDNKNFLLVKKTGQNFMSLYRPFIENYWNKKIRESEKKFQLIRRGRYTEFNLIYDRGTRFGLVSGGRVESILMSLPQYVEFLYDWQPKYIFEKKMLSYYQDPREWNKGKY